MGQHCLGVGSGEAVIIDLRLGYLPKLGDLLGGSYKKDYTHMYIHVYTFIDIYMYICIVFGCIYWGPHFGKLPSKAKKGSSRVPLHLPNRGNP